MSEKKQFLAGFGWGDITPQDSVPMASYGDDLRRFSEGTDGTLDARAVALTDENGVTLLLLTGDQSWGSIYLGKPLKAQIEAELGVPADHVMISGIHNHDAVAANHDHLPEILRFHERYQQGMFAAAKAAMADRKPARLFAGSAITNKMNFIRRYIMDDGSLIGDNAYGTGTVIVSHESDADPELQLVRIVREGGEDILLSNFQAHPHLEGKKKIINSQAIGAFRTEVEQRFGFKSLHWNGAAGNINTHSRIKAESPPRDNKLWAAKMADYAEAALPLLTEVRSGPIRVASTTVSAKINHAYDPLVPQAEQVRQYFRDGHSAKETAQYAWQFGIHSFYHANRIVTNSQAGEAKEMLLQAFSFGDVGGVVVPYEMFDTNGMQIKRNSPLRKTFIVGYSWPGYGGYIPSQEAFKNGGYEADNCSFVPGTAEMLVQKFLELLEQVSK